MSKRSIQVLFFLFLAVAACAAPKNIILMIGDGMGTSQLTAGKVAKGTLSVERMDVGGLCTTFAANALVTDSAAAGTALATGQKTANKHISTTPDGKPLETIAEAAKENGKAVGLVTTCSLTHATPAAFATHVTSRYMNQDIAKQLVDAKFNVLFGGGWAWLVPKNSDASSVKEDLSPAGYGKKETSSGKRTDGVNLLVELEKQMTVATTPNAFRALGKTDRAAALLYSLHPPAAAEREVSLPELTAKALEILARDEDGFFLMVEGSQIDWAGHKNNKEWLIDEVVDFDDAVGVVLDFAEMNPDTLVVVTADHETGGFAVQGGSLKDKKVTNAAFTWGNHTASMVPVFATGPGSDAFGGLIDNALIGHTLKKFASGE